MSYQPTEPIGALTMTQVTQSRSHLIAKESAENLSLDLIPDEFTTAGEQVTYYVHHKTFTQVLGAQTFGSHVTTRYGANSAYNCSVRVGHVPTYVEVCPDPFHCDHDNSRPAQPRYVSAASYKALHKS